MGMPPSAPSAPPGQPAPPGAGASSPMGSSPATGPTQNLGAQAQGVQMAAALVEMMAGMIPQVGANTELGQAVAKAMLDIGKHVPPGAASPQAKENQMKAAMMRQQQMRPQMAAIQSQSGGAPPPPQPPPSPGMAA